MPDNQNKSDSLANTVNYLQIVAFLTALLYLGKTLLIPLFFGLLVAIVAYPTCKRMEARKIHRSIAVTVLMLIVVLLFSSLLWLLGYEMNLFIDNIPLVRNKITQFSSEIRIWLETSFSLRQAAQDNLFAKIMASIEDSINNLLSGSLSATVSTIFMLVLVPIYGSLFLYNRGTFVKFLESVVEPKYKEKLNIILKQSIITYFNFVKGTFFVYCIVGVLNSIGLLALGIKHAILFGMITAFMTAVPYVGIIVSAALPVSVALVTKDSMWYAVGVVAVFMIVQYVEANIIFPRVVGQQLNLSTWAVLVAIIAGALLWGVAGMILFIPFAAMLKIVSDNIEEWKPLNILLNRDDG